MSASRQPVMDGWRLGHCLVVVASAYVTVILQMQVENPLRVAPFFEQATTVSQHSIAFGSLAYGGTHRPSDVVCVVNVNQKARPPIVQRPRNAAALFACYYRAAGLDRLADGAGVGLGFRGMDPYINLFHEALEELMMGNCPPEFDAMLAEFRADLLPSSSKDQQSRARHTRLQPAKGRQSNLHILHT